MFHRITDFEYEWYQEIEATQKVFKHVSDKSLNQVIHPDVRTLGRLAWHITITIPEMMNKTGLSITKPHHDDPIPSSTKQIFAAYNEAAIAVLDEVKKKWTDATLPIEDEMYGQKWKRGHTLSALVKHQIHHRGEMIVLMRMAGLAVPGLYGPTRDEWAKWGMKEPAV